jgi:hypothetical protein
MLCAMVPGKIVGVWETMAMCERRDVVFSVSILLPETRREDERVWVGW